jgi:hypothetical protein
MSSLFRSPKTKDIWAWRLAGWAAIVMGVVLLIVVPITQPMVDRCDLGYFSFWNTTLYWKETPLLTLVCIGWLCLSIVDLLRKLKHLESEKKPPDEDQDTVY